MACANASFPFSQFTLVWDWFLQGDLLPLEEIGKILSFPAGSLPWETEGEGERWRRGGITNREQSFIHSLNKPLSASGN